MSDRPVPNWKFRLWLLLWMCVGAWLAFVVWGCVPTSHPGTPQPPPFNEAAARGICEAVWQAELFRSIDQPALVACLDQQRHGVSEQKIRDQVRASGEWAAKHAPEPDRPFGQVVKGRLHFDTKARYSDGSEFTWSGSTAMQLLERVAHGQEAQAAAWLKAQRKEGVTIVRPLAMNHGWFNLTPEDGREALPKLLALAKREDVYVQIVALAGTKDRPRAFLDEQVKSIGAICASAENCVLELANEPYHGSQHPSLVKPSTLASLRAKVPTSVPVTYGAPRTDEPLQTAPMIDGRKDDGTLYCGGDFVVLHRKRNKDIWDDLRRFTELQKVAKACGKFTVDSEPFGFAETAKVGTNTRRTEAYAGFGQGSLARLFGLGSNFHCEAGLTAIPLGPKQLAALREFIAGYRLVPPGVTFRFVNGKAGDSAVKDASFIGPSCGGCAVMRGFSFFAPGRNYFAWVGLKPSRDPKPIWQNGWKPKTPIAERPGYQLLELTK